MPLYGTGYTGSAQVASNIGKENKYVYSDISFIFKPSPSVTKHGLSGDIVQSYDSQAVKQSVRNIINSNDTDRPWIENFGCNLRNYLFEEISPWTSYTIKKTIREQLEIWEPRIQLKDIVVNLQPDKNTIDIQVNYSSDVIDEPADEVNVAVRVERVR